LGQCLALWLSGVTLWLVNDLGNKLSAVMARATGKTGDVAALTRLTGGANMESWSFDHAGYGYVLRRALSLAMMEGRSFGHDVEAAVVHTAHCAGILAPEVTGVLGPSDGLGSGYIMARIEGEVRPDKILANAPPSLITDIARELALIHAQPVNPALPLSNATDMVAELKARFIGYGGDRPVMALTLAWLEDHLPTRVPPVFLHGDFRMGNLIVGADGLSAVLDWELAHSGDAHEDLVWGCINSWRFGHSDRPAFGLCDLATYWSAYKRAGGVRVDPARFRFWLVYRTLWWGLCCLQMADIWRSGIDTGLERAVIGRRASETEVDLLMLLEQDAPPAERGAIAMPPPPTPRALGEPDSAELIEAIAAWISDDIRPGATGRDRFLASVALNALGMLARDERSPAAVHNPHLSGELLSRRVTLSSPGLLATLKRSALAKLAVDQPRYSALSVAYAAWVDTDFSS
jgi:aminoglycoside phosphotransferase (APT) family kinase protein